MSVSSGPDIDKPRILCLHGAGVSAKIFRLQMKYFLAKLAPHFRLVFADAPYDSEIAPPIKGVYDSKGPFKRWFRWQVQQPMVDRYQAIEDIEESLMSAMEADPGTGEWVGLLGFSQGATVAASILLENQFRQSSDRYRWGFAGQWWKFGIFVAGYILPCSLSPLTANNQYFDHPGAMITPPLEDKIRITSGFPNKLRVPTFHVHGLRDPDLRYHIPLYRDCCDSNMAALYEWDDGHRMPYKTADVMAIVQGVVKTAKVATPDFSLRMVPLPVRESSSEDVVEGAWPTTVSRRNEIRAV